MVVIYYYVRVCPLGTVKKVDLRSTRSLHFDGMIDDYFQFETDEAPKAKEGETNLVLGVSCGDLNYTQHNSRLLPTPLRWIDIHRYGASALTAVQPAQRSI